MLKKFLLLTVALLLCACSSTTTFKQDRTASISITAQNDAELTTFIGQLKTNRPTQFPNTSARAKSLAKVYDKWAGTRYRLGGTNLNGIDCSGFIRETFAVAFGIQLPRSTAEQRYVGRSIPKSELKLGDLVFFRGNNHVGVYIGNNSFMHSSTKDGVTINSLDDGYWKRTYTQSRRIM